MKIYFLLLFSPLCFFESYAFVAGGVLGVQEEGGLRLLLRLPSDFLQSTSEHWFGTFGDPRSMTSMNCNWRDWLGPSNFNLPRSMLSLASFAQTVFPFTNTLAN